MQTKCSFLIKCAPKDAPMPPRPMSRIGPAYVQSDFFSLMSFTVLKSG